MKPKAIIDIVSDELEIPVEKLISKTRDAEIVRARFIAMYFIRKKTDTKFKAIGKIFKRDHSSVMHGCKEIENALYLQFGALFKEFIRVSDRLDKIFYPRQYATYRTNVNNTATKINFAS